MSNWVKGFTTEHARAIIGNGSLNDAEDRSTSHTCNRCAKRVWVKDWIGLDRPEFVQCPYCFSMQENPNRR